VAPTGAKRTLLVWKRAKAQELLPWAAPFLRPMKAPKPARRTARPPHETAPHRESFRNAYYVKLGTGGRWADESIERGILRFGWSGIPLAEIHAGAWDQIRDRLAREHSNKGTVTADTARLRDIVTSGPLDVWVTFHDSRLWWGRLGQGRAREDRTSKYRTMSVPWRDTDAHGRRLLLHEIPGALSQTQASRGTVCSVKARDALERLLNGEASPAYHAVEQARTALVGEAAAAIRELHWKDFETLVDLVFRNAGWRRRSMLGQTMKFADLELEEPITGELYQVQVKSRADANEFRAYADAFSGSGYRRLYFVVHSPSENLSLLTDLSEDVALVLPDRLSEWVVDAGLVSWLLAKIR